MEYSGFRKKNARVSLLHDLGTPIAPEEGTTSPARSRNN